MPTYEHPVWSGRHWCAKPYRWSTSRGGCRFESNHTGNCKPKARGGRDAR